MASNTIGSFLYNEIAVPGAQFVTPSSGGNSFIPGSNGDINGGNGRDGILIGATELINTSRGSVLLVANIIGLNGSAGLQLYGANSVSTNNNAMLLNVGNGIQFDSGATNNILNNDKVENNDGDGVLFDQSSGNSLTAITIQYNTGQGIRSVNSPSNLILGGTDTNNQGGS